MQIADTLVQASSRASALPVDLDELAGLPAPVAKYFARVLHPGQPRIRLARFRQSGALRTGARKNRWVRFEATQIVAPPATGFLWDARVRLAPLVLLRVSDALVDGRGSGEVHLFSAFTVSSAQGDPQMNAGALHRYLAEAVWYPTALLPGDSLRWSAIDHHGALATLTAYGVTVSLEFRFADTGEVTGIYTPGRWGTFDGGFRQVPWEGHFRNYVRHGGMLVPAEGEVGWWLEGRWRCIFRGTLLEATYNGKELA